MIYIISPGKCRFRSSPRCSAKNFLTNVRKILDPPLFGTASSYLNIKCYLKEFESCRTILVSHMSSCNSIILFSSVQLHLLRETKHVRSVRIQ